MQTATITSNNVAVASFPSTVVMERGLVNFITKTFCSSEKHEYYIGRAYVSFSSVYEERIPTWFLRVQVHSLDFGYEDSCILWKKRMHCNRGVTRRGKRGTVPRAPKSPNQQCRKYFDLYNTFASERP